ncbi:MAG: DUF2226 domain-containing protein [Candidatus Diapherotrites archaeon]|nr:DUF2226 domain-containing protein [Candidatus Diapherotrites archaeon]
MNFPLGKIIEDSIKINSDWRKKISDFDSQRFTGYIVITLQGIDGIEEGVLAFLHGKAIACFYEFTKFDLSVFGEKALPMFFNSLNAEQGIGEIHETSSQQIELIVAFNESIKLRKELSRNDLNKFFTSSFTSKYAKETIANALNEMESRSDIFKRVGLTNLNK